MSYAKKSLKSHVHGLSVAQVYVEVEGPSESFLGFEHRPKTAKEKASWKNIQSIWKNKSGDLFSVKDMSCSFEKKRIALVFEEDDHGKEKHHDEDKKTAEHSEIKAEMYIVCEKMVSGPVLNVSLNKGLLRTGEVEAHVLLQNGKFYKKDIEKGTGSLKL
ncbi:MAG: DUF2796 domain-containing protein [Bdellovibrionota bacterium]|nr:DUF2796 domain-containing protein [Bdellovibrionota bacterium]